MFDQQAKLPAVLWPYFTKTAIKRLSKCELFKAKMTRFEAVRTKKLHWSFKWTNKPQSRAVLKEYIFLIKLKLTKLQTNRIIVIIVKNYTKVRVFLFPTFVFLCRFLFLLHILRDSGSLVLSLEILGGKLVRRRLKLIPPSISDV